MESKDIIRRVGYYSTSQADQDDCVMCENAMYGTVIINGVCLACRDLIMIHGNWHQANECLQEYIKGIIDKEDANKFLNNCLPKPEDFTNH